MNESNSFKAFILICHLIYWTNGFTCNSFHNNFRPFPIISVSLNALDAAETISLTSSDKSSVLEIKQTLNAFAKDRESKEILFLNFDETLKSIQGNDLITELEIIELLGREKHHDSAPRCEVALRKLIDYYKMGRYDELLEDIDKERTLCVFVEAFNVCLFAWSKSDSPDCGKRAEEVLELMATLDDVDPDIKSFTS